MGSSELEEWVYEQRMAKWRAEHFATTTASVTTHFVLQSNATTASNNQTGNLVELLLQQQNQQQNQQQQQPQLRNAKARVPSVLKRVMAELIG